MSQVKKSLWNKLHSAKAAMKDSVNQLAQIMVNRAQAMIPQQVQNYIQLAPIVQRERPLFLAQTSPVDEGNTTQSMVVQPPTRRMHHKKQDVSSVKQMNTHGTMILYFCIMTVLVFCCLSKCLIVPLTQASRYEINNRKHISKLDKNGLIQKEVIE